jgi:hypothetical protein
MSLEPTMNGAAIIGANCDGASYDLATHPMLRKPRSVSGIHPSAKERLQG